jgi:hypothetical protein
VPRRVVPCSGMTGYTIIPKRNGYSVQASEGAEVRVLRTWPTEAEAVTHLRALQAAAAKTEQKPAPERQPSRPISPYRTTHYW